HMPRKPKKARKRYTAAEKAKILATAKKERLTGEQVEKRFGINKLTFYRWRGPVRSDAVARRGKRGPGRPRVQGKVAVSTTAVREAVRAHVRRILPQIVREEVEAALR